MTLSDCQTRLALWIKMVDTQSLILTDLSYNYVHPRIWIEPGLPSGLTLLP